jgi:protein phosphatase
MAVRGLLTIGEFARASRLTPKALRLYDELGLLPPAYVDPASGYRFYAPGQLDDARLVAWLRRLGMPLARIRTVRGLPQAEKAADVAAYWAGVEADTAARAELAAFLVDHLAARPERTTTMPKETPRLGISYATRSDIGRTRPHNEDRAYAGARLLAVADGYGAAGGEPASAAAIEALKPLDTEVPAGDLLNALERAITSADAAVREFVAADPAHAGRGTTLTAMVLSGSQLALVHVGDCRAYLLRGGDLFQITHDHTMVQSLIDEGRLTPDEAASHPERLLLLRALSGAGVEPDLHLREARAGDRYLLCSDGLSTVVDTATVKEVLRTVADPDAAVLRLVELANAGGGPDNVTCVVADVTELG